MGGGGVVLGVSSGRGGPEVGARRGRAAAKWSAGPGECRGILIYDRRSSDRFIFFSFSIFFVVFC